MDKIWNLFFTIAAGTYIIGFLVTVIYIVKSDWLPRRLEQIPPRLSAFVTLCIYTATLCAGVLSENLSKRIISEDGLRSVWTFLFCSESKVRSEALVDKRRKTTPLFWDLCNDRCRIRERYFNDNLLQIHAAACMNPVLCEKMYKTLQANCNTLFYKAKNRVYMENTYFEELDAKVHRRDFARSIAICSFFLGGLAFLLAGYEYVRRSVARRAGDDGTARKRVQRFGQKAVWFLQVGAFCVAVYLVSICGYRQVLNDYNRHVFGYFQSIEVREQERPQAAHGVLGPDAEQPENRPEDALPEA